jgi:hypothetical protein
MQDPIIFLIVMSKILTFEMCVSSLEFCVLLRKSILWQKAKKPGNHASSSQIIASRSSVLLIENTILQIDLIQ